MQIRSVETVNFYGDPLEVAITDENQAYVLLSQITGYLGLDADSIIERFERDPRVGLEIFDGQAIVPLTKLNGFLMLLPVAEVPEDLRGDLMRYQTECFEALHDYWINGVAINRRENPSDINSKFKDERVISRKLLIDACAKFCKNDEVLDPDDLFNKVLSASYRIIGLEPKHEHEKFTGVEASYLAWVEAVFARCIDKFATWGEAPQDVISEAAVHVEEHLRNTGMAWMQMADNVPTTLYRN